MNLTPFQTNKLAEWAEWVLSNGAMSPMPRSLNEVREWAFFAAGGVDRPFPRFDMDEPYTFG